MCVDIDLNLCNYIQICCDYIANVCSCQSIFRSLSPLLINIYAYMCSWQNLVFSKEPSSNSCSFRASP